ncbi:MAG: outer membrane lipoprotein carrier protein LolA [Deltaproteobacteria bacterium]|nr:MAG: outer membrane lipoprotein carrier protein LolA [Deltaproteobacteria bacterium]
MILLFACTHALLLCTAAPAPEAIAPAAAASPTAGGRPYLVAAAEAGAPAAATAKKSGPAKKAKEAEKAPPERAAALTSAPAARAKRPGAAPDERPAEGSSRARKETVSPEARPLVEKLQAFYEGTQDFTATFEQTYTYKAFARTMKSRGKVAFKKPGLMRWSYEKPREKHFIVDGKDMWVWTPEDRTVIRKKGFTTDGLSTSITFLFGKGRLEEEFAIELEGKNRLVLTPLSPQPGFVKVIFEVDPETGQVRSSEVYDAAGNVNRMRFRDVRINPGVKPERFRFTPPKGATVQELADGALH